MKWYSPRSILCALVKPVLLFATFVTIDGPHNALRVEYNGNASTTTTSPETQSTPDVPPKPMTFTTTYHGLGDVTFESSTGGGLVEAIFQYPETNVREGVEFAAVLFDDAQCILGNQMALTENARLPKKEDLIISTPYPFHLTVMDADTSKPKVQILANVHEFDANEFYWDPPTTSATNSEDGKLEFCLQFQVIMNQASTTYLITFVDVHITLRVDWN
jgi:hypothetical protein